jgi:hypothetical protein
MSISREQIFRVTDLVCGSCPCEAGSCWYSLMNSIYSTNCDYILLRVGNLTEEKYSVLITEIPIGRVLKIKFSNIF